MRFFTIVFSGEGVQATESLSGHREMAASELKPLTASLLKDRTNGGDASGIEFLGVLLGVICTGFVSLVPL